ncbi:unnamed protein product [Pleuronectes platessa]|uniref:Uncharacterized protein n=1 Tax=Pleuronectes platessa TaxID=8262 RepID=A0A9N7V2C8_PLEPL|nr:unnamed protein product [Pleuronectes platessa]
MDEWTGMRMACRGGERTLEESGQQRAGKRGSGCRAHVGGGKWSLQGCIYHNESQAHRCMMQLIQISYKVGHQEPSTALFPLGVSTRGREHLSQSPPAQGSPLCRGLQLALEAGVGCSGDEINRVSMGDDSHQQHGTGATHQAFSQQSFDNSLPPGRQHHMCSLSLSHRNHLISPALPPSSPTLTLRTDPVKGQGGIDREHEPGAGGARGVVSLQKQTDFVFARGLSSQTGIDPELPS